MNRDLIFSSEGSGLPRQNSFAVRLIVGLGIVVRVARLGARFPYWTDEAAVALNLHQRDWTHLFDPLDYHQVAPRLFLAVEKLAMQVLGEGETALRIFPCLMGIAALLLFARLAGELLQPRAALVAISFAALSLPPIDLSCQAKPYSCDLLATVFILLFAARAMRSETPWRHGWPLVVLLPVLMGFSFACLLVVAAVIPVGFLAVFMRRRDFTRAQLFRQVAYWSAVSLVGGAGYLVFDVPRHMNEETTAFMRQFWALAFPPHSPLALLEWLLTIRTSGLSAYPVGGVFTPITAVFALVGFVLFLRSQPWLMLWLVGPFVTTFAAAWVQQYPFGFKVRVAQHLAPAVWILAGSGVACAISLLRFKGNSAVAQKIATAAICLLFVGMGVSTVVADMFWPYQAAEDAQYRQIASSVVANGGGGVILTAPPTDLPLPLLWYLRALPVFSADALPASLPKHLLIVDIEPDTPRAIVQEEHPFPGVLEKSWQIRGNKPHTQVRITLFHE